MANTEKKSVKETLDLAYDALREKGYDPIAQLIGYLLSEDPGYLTSYKKAKYLIGYHDREAYLEELLKNYFAGK